MLMIRLQRTGRRNEPTFRVVLTDSKNAAKSGKSLEVLGAYDSRRAEKAEINADRIKYWMSQGAKLSGTLHNLMISKKLITGKKINVLSKKSPIKKDGAADAAAPAAAELVPAAEVAPAAETQAETPAEVPAEAPVQA
jgi:small subunit ribosomal protein S16